MHFQGYLRRQGRWNPLHEPGLSPVMDVGTIYLVQEQLAQPSYFEIT